MFGKKDSIKEFEQMRQALKPAERFASRADNENDAAARDGATAHTTSTAIGVPMPIDGLSSKSLTGNEDCSTVLSGGTAWQGSLKTQGSVRVEGQLAGEIDATDTVFVAEGAQVDAKIRAAFVVLAGQFKGEVNCRERLEIMPTGQVRAELTTKSLVVHEGAFMEGQIHMTDEKHASNGQQGGSSRTGATPAKPEVKDSKPSSLSPASV